MNYSRNVKLTLNALVEYQKNITVTDYEWSLNKSFIYNSESVTLYTNLLNRGKNYITLKVKNSCGLWSKEITKVINITNKK